MGLFGAAHASGCKNAHLHKICHTYPTMMKLAQLYLTLGRFKTYINENKMYGSGMGFVASRVGLLISPMENLPLRLTPEKF